MKTSNKWVLATLVVLLGALTAFNVALRDEHRRGAYKDPTRNTVALRFQDFNEIDVQAASQMGVKVVAGPYSVRLNKEAEKYMKITQQGGRLVLAVVYPEGREPLGSRQVAFISCPQLRRLTVGATYRVKGQTQQDKSVGFMRPVQVSGFTQDSLRVQQDLGSQVELANNRLGYLQAEAGRSPGSQSVLRIEKSNRIQAADLSVQHQAVLALEAGGIARLRTQFGDSVRATLSGAGLGNLGTPLAH